MDPSPSDTRAGLCWHLAAWAWLAVAGNWGPGREQCRARQLVCGRPWRAIPSNSTSRVDLADTSGGPGAACDRLCRPRQGASQATAAQAVRRVAIASTRHNARMASGQQHGSRSERRPGTVPPPCPGIVPGNGCLRVPGGLPPRRRPYRGLPARAVLANRLRGVYSPWAGYSLTGIGTRARRSS